ncbi:MAG TPA: UvrD-helicase domain-containing protein [Actinomycetota bacterium]|nr:UvrD-helicase domain-containing protein [Actinomycetota bacterium]
MEPQLALDLSQPAGPGQRTDLLAGLNDRQREAASFGDGPLLIVAGAGSGKTAVLTRRVASLIRDRDVPPFSILAITFTNKAAAQMRERIEALIGPVVKTMWIGTFHSMMARLLRREAPRLGTGHTSSFTIYDSADSDRLVTHILKQSTLSASRFKPAQVRHAISRAKDELLGPEALEGSGRWELRQIAPVYAEYQRLLREANAMDFDDLIANAVAALRIDEVAANYRNRWRHLLVDEFQDTNAAQFELVRLLKAPDGNICVVGDMDQSIYAFRGADYRNLMRFEQAFPKARVITLDRNYRSTQNILSAANALIDNNRQRKPKNLWTDLGTGDLVGRYLATDEHDEAAYVAIEIDRLRETEGYRYRDIAVFYRTNAQSRVIEEVFTRFGVPYRVLGGLRFYERKEVKDLLAYLRVVVNTADTASIRRIINVPRRGVGDKSVAVVDAHATFQGITLWESLEDAAKGAVEGLSNKALGGLSDFVSLIRELRDIRGSGATIAQIMEAALAHSGYLAELEADRSIEGLGRVENLKELAAAASQAELEIPDLTLDDYLSRVALVSESDDYDAESSTVSLMTMHNAKGLEFPVVFITGLEDGVFPHIRSLGNPDELEEERRLAYVGITRAKERLYLLHARQRSLSGHFGYNTPSKFLAEIPPEVVRVIGDTAVTSSPSRAQRAPEFPDVARAAAAWRVGQSVEHERWGSGVITALSGSAARAEATVWFSGLGEKRLLLAYAPIKAVD